MLRSLAMSSLVRLLAFALLLAVPAAGLAGDLPRATDCTSRALLRVHFYDVGQASAALVELPDGRTILVDAGGDRTALAPKLERDLRGRPISLAWITHPHDDHLNQFKAVLRHARVEVYADNGFDGGAPSRSDSRGLGVRMRAEAVAKGARVVTIGPDRRDAPIPGSGAALRFTPVVPTSWTPACAKGHSNNCSIGLRIDYCDSSVLFMGDAEAAEEKFLRGLGPVGLLGLPHHGSKTSSTASFLAATRPRYVVISVGDTGNSHCHPSARTIERVGRALGGSSTSTVPASVDSRPGQHATACVWTRTARSDRLWLTSVDGDVVLATRGDGVFVRE
jgi:competence protein ComEC